MTCILNGLLNECGRNNVPGITELYIGVNTGLTYTVDVDYVVTGITGVTYHTYQPAPTSSSWSDEGSGQLEFLNWSHIHKVSAFFPGNSKDVRNEIYLLSQSKLSIIVKTMKGEYFLLGPDNGMWATTSNYNSGKKAGDGNGWTWEASGESSQPALRVDPSIISSLVS